MKRQVLALMVGVSVAAAVVLNQSGAAPPDVNKVRQYMRPKLEHSQKLLEGLALEDYDMIARQSAAISLMSQGSNWDILQTEEYLRSSQEFRKAADAITAAAKAKDLEQATDGYLDLTRRCVECHKYLRKVRANDAD